MKVASDKALTLATGVIGRICRLSGRSAWSCRFREPRPGRICERESAGRSRSCSHNLGPPIDLRREAADLEQSIWLAFAARRPTRTGPMLSARE